MHSVLWGDIAPLGFAMQNAGVRTFASVPPSKKDPFGSYLLGGGGEIRTPAAGLPTLMI